MDEGTLFGRYRLERLLGAGAMGQVYRAFDTETDRIVAVKVLVPHLAEDEKFQARFRQEARTAAGLNDPHVVPIHNFGEIDGRLYVDMRLIEGHDLGSAIANGPMSPENAVSVVEQIGSALDAAHHAGLVHRDVKPSNILVTERNFAYLIDFGIARGAESSGLTSAGHTMGTLAYMAPERFQTGECDPRSDIYALACVLHECLTGRRPFDAESLEQQIAAHMMAPPPRPSVLQLRVPASLDNVVARGMAKNPNHRYRTAPELAAAARAALTGGHSEAPPPPPTTPQTQRAPQSGYSQPQLQKPQGYSHPQMPAAQSYSQPQLPKPQGYSHPQQPSSQQPSQPQPVSNFSSSPFGTASQPQQNYGAPAPKKSGKAIIGVAGGIAVVLIVVALLGFWMPGFFITTQLDIDKAQDGVKTLLEDGTNGYGARNVGPVTCNDGNTLEVEVGGTFTCDVDINGYPMTVTSTFTDKKGAFEVGAPQPR